MRITNKIKEDYEKLKKATKRKVRNTVKNQGPTIHDIQNGEVVSYDIRDKLNMPSLESFKTKKDYDEWAYNQRKFTSGRSPHFKFFKNEHGTVMTDYLKIVLQNKHHQAEKTRLKEAKKLIEGGLEERVERESIMMAHPTIPAFTKIKLDFNMLWNVGDIDRKLRGLIIKGSPEDIMGKKEQLKKNFVKALQETFNSDLDQLVNMVEEIPADDFYVLYQLHIKHFSISNFHYEVEMPSQNRDLGMIYMTLANYAENKPELAMMLKDF